MLDQNTRDELREVLASFNEDIEHAMKPVTMDATKQHELRLRAIEAALTVALNALANPE